MKIWAVLTFLIVIFSAAHAQLEIEHEAVMKPVKMLFEGMQKGDSALAHGAFTKEVTTATISAYPNGKPFFQTESSIKEFIKAIGTPHSEPWNEMIWEEKIIIDGNFAQAWANYAFYIGKKFSHCGVDAFHLVKSEDGTWKIFHLTDTRKKGGCHVPPMISKQFE